MAKNPNAGMRLVRYFMFPSVANYFFLFILALTVLSLLGTMAGCGGGGDNDTPPSDPKNVGGGYTLKASGGTLNDGVGTNGLVVLTTLRDSGGNGPGAAGWMVTITGPGISVPLTESYDDGSTSSYIIWMWDSITPLTGTYTASATNGTTTLTYGFTIDATKMLQPRAVTKLGSIVSWNAVTGAGSYFYTVTNGSGTPVMNGDLPVATTSFTLPGLPDGSYLAEVYAYTGDISALGNDQSSSPVLPAQENVSFSATEFILNASYAMDARVGVLYEGTTGAAPATDHYGLVIWSSILTAPASTATVPTPPAGDWNITVTGPGLPLATAADALKFKYPATYAQYAYWDYRTLDPSGGPYTVTAVSSYGTATISQVISIPTPTAKLPLPTGVAVTPGNGGGASASWNPVPGAGSYYVNVWTDVDGTYTEIAGSWVNATSALILNGTLTKNITYDLYVTSCTLDMTDVTTVPPSDPGSQVNMSDPVFTYTTFIAQ